MNNTNAQNGDNQENTIINFFTKIIPDAWQQLCTLSCYNDAQKKQYSHRDVIIITNANLEQYKLKYELKLDIFEEAQDIKKFRQKIQKYYDNEEIDEDAYNYAINRINDRENILKVDDMKLVRYQTPELNTVQKQTLDGNIAFYTQEFTSNNKLLKNSLDVESLNDSNYSYSKQNVINKGIETPKFGCYQPSVNSKTSHHSHEGSRR